jgi:CRISPR-associated exonuclease Cas4
MYSEDDLIPLSALQHYVFCRRQCALIHIEQIWQENVFTLEGRIFHDKVHSGKSEKRRATRTQFGMPVRSLELGLSGKTDTVEYGDDGTVRIIEMKRGRSKTKGMDEIQLCSQAMCLEEMLSLSIPEGWLFYRKARRRKTVVFTPELRTKTSELAHEVHRFLDAGQTPPPLPDEKCPRCSLYGVCLPGPLARRRNVAKYIARALGSKATENEE